MHAKTYLNKILKNHGWECATKEEDKIIQPIHPDSIKEFESAIVPSSEVESNQPEVEEDIGYGVAELSKFSASPACCHYKAIKRLYLYLQQTIDWGIIFWRHEPR
eukprot:13604810-Ditylum_brightwellii.AAC.1